MKRNSKMLIPNISKFKKPLSRIFRCSVVIGLSVSLIMSVGDTTVCNKIKDRAKTSIRKTTPSYLSKFIYKKAKDEGESLEDKVNIWPFINRDSALHRIHELIKEENRHWHEFEKLSYLLNKPLDSILVDENYPKLISIIDSCLSDWAEASELTRIIGREELLDKMEMSKNTYRVPYLVTVQFFLTEGNFYGLGKDTFVRSMLPLVLNNKK